MKKCNLWLVSLLFSACFVGVSPAAYAGQLFVVHFETGPAWQADLPPNKQPGFGEHAGNLQALRNSGVIKFGARYEHFGMIVIASDDLASATALINQDPGVTSELFTFRIALMNVFYPWQVTTTD